MSLWEGGRVQPHLAGTTERSTIVLGKRTRRILTIAVAATAAIGLIATSASAVLTGHGGSTYTRVVARTENVAWSAVPTNGVFVDLPNAILSVTVPAGTTRQVEADFTAESFCGGNAGWCPVRIVRVAAPVVELSPDSDLDFAFDSAGGDTYQAGAIKRFSGTLGAGTYRFKVQATRYAGATSVRLDDWAFKVALIAP